MSSVYSEAQISAFLSRIGLPPKSRSSGNAKDDLHLLTQAHIHMISTIPYENLSLHYSKTRKVVIDPLVAFEKIITAKRGRGGYCFEVNIPFYHLLRGLGFSVYMAPVRARYRMDGVPEGEFKGWAHAVNLVTLSDGTKWMSDTGFGGDGPTTPLELIEDQVRCNLGSQENRLVLDHIPTQTLRTPETRLWIYQYRNDPKHEWNSFYAFGELEAMEADFYIMNWYAGHSPGSFQTFRQLIVKFLRREVEGRSEIYGKRMLVDAVVKENLGGKTKVVKECKSEAERMETLKELFGMEFTEEERDGIRGWCTEIK